MLFLHPFLRAVGRDLEHALHPLSEAQIEHFIISIHHAGRIPARETLEGHTLDLAFRNNREFMQKVGNVEMEYHVER